MKRWGGTDGRLDPKTLSLTCSWRYGIKSFGLGRTSLCPIMVGVRTVLAEEAALVRRSVLLKAVSKMGH